MLAACKGMLRQQLVYLGAGAISMVGKALRASKAGAGILFTTAPHFGAATECTAGPVLAVRCHAGAAANQGALARVGLGSRVAIVACNDRKKTRPEVRRR